MCRRSSETFLVRTELSPFHFSTIRLLDLSLLMARRRMNLCRAGTLSASSPCHTLPFLLSVLFHPLTLLWPCIVSRSRSVWRAACLTCSGRCYLFKCLRSSHCLRRRPNKGCQSTPLFSNGPTPFVSPRRLFQEL